MAYQGGGGNGSGGINVKHISGVSKSEEEGNRKLTKMKNSIAYGGVT